MASLAFKEQEIRKSSRSLQLYGPKRRARLHKILQAILLNTHSLRGRFSRTVLCAAPCRLAHSPSF